jgi:hypothetical protein
LRQVRSVLELKRLVVGNVEGVFALLVVEAANTVTLRFKGAERIKTGARDEAIIYMFDEAGKEATRTSGSQKARVVT